MAEEGADQEVKREKEEKKRPTGKVNFRNTIPTQNSGTFRNPQPLVFSQKYRRHKWEAYCGTNRRRIAVQIGGVLRRFPFSEA